MVLVVVAAAQTLVAVAAVVAGPSAVCVGHVVVGAVLAGPSAGHLVIVLVAAAAVPSVVAPVQLGQKLQANFAAWVVARFLSQHKC